MNSINLKLAVLAVGIACTFGSLGGASAATVSAPTAQSVAPMSMAGNGSVELVKKHRHHGGKRYYRNRHHGGSFFFYGAPFYNDYGYYGYNPYYYSNSCYRECRYYHGPRYCRRYWRRFCD